MRVRCGSTGTIDHRSCGGDINRSADTDGYVDFHFATSHAHVYVDTRTNAYRDAPNYCDTHADRYSNPRGPGSTEPAGLASQASHA